MPRWGFAADRRLPAVERGYRVDMSIEPNGPTPPASDEADPEQQTTPAGQVERLEELADETGAETGDPPAV